MIAHFPEGRRCILKSKVVRGPRKSEPVMFSSLKAVAILGIVCATGVYAQGLVGIKIPGGQIRFQAVDELQIEGSHRVRLMPIATQQVTPDDAKRFPREELAQIGTIRGDAGHRLVKLDDAGKPSDLILADSFAPRTPVDVATALGRPTIQAIQSKKAKTGEAISPEAFFVYVSGVDADRLALTLINRADVFLNLDEQLAAMEGFAVSFPDSPLQAEFRSQLQDRIHNGLSAFDNHGSYSDLLLTRRFVDLGRRTFPNDAALGALSAQFLGLIQTIDVTRLKLQALAAANEWDLLLEAYAPFEHYQWSFPDMMALRQTALEESARLHAHRGTLLAERQLNTDALQEFKAAVGRDPDNREIAMLLDASNRSDKASGDAGGVTRSDLEKKRSALREQLQKLQKDGEYSKLRLASMQALTLDPEDEDFLYYGGISAALFRDQDAAKDRLDRYLRQSNSLRGDLQARDRAFRIRATLNVPAPPSPSSEGTPNWLSGKPAADGIYYCPVSGAFQLPIDGVAGYKLKMTFQWDRTRLNNITTTFDDDKGSANYHSLGGAPDSLGNFFFSYAGTDQMQIASIHRFDGAASMPELRVSRDRQTPPHLVDEHGVPRILLQDSPQFNLAVLTILEGPLATGVAGNSFFNPFIWDGLHYFALTYDNLGRLAAAREWNTDNIVRFTWSANRLTEVHAFRKESSNPYYQRLLNYSGPMLTGESYALGNKTGQIKYVYAGKVLQQVKVEDGGVHDGKTWTVRMR